MSSNRPLFDDDDLPTWLTDAGITHADPTPATDDHLDAGDQSWMDRLDTATPTSTTAAADDNLNWMQVDAPINVPTESPAASSATASVTGELDWRKTSDQSGAGDQAADDLSLDWVQPAPLSAPGSKPAGGLTGMLPWRQGVSNSYDEVLNHREDALPWEQANQESSPASGDLPDLEAIDWLNKPAEPVVPPIPPVDSVAVLPAPSIPVQPIAEAPAEQSTPSAAAPSAEPPPESKPIRGLKSRIKADVPPTASHAEPTATTPEPPSALPSTDSKPIKSLKPLPKADSSTQAAAPSTTEPPASRSNIKKLGAPSQPSEADLANATYDQWDAAQRAKQSATPEEDLLNAVPSYLNQTTPPAPGAPADSAGGEFMPEWFLGMEEQKPDAAPDWFNSLDLAHTSLQGGSASPTAVTPPAAAPTPPASDVPDWYQGTGSDNLDFDSLFGSKAQAPTTSERTPPPTPSMPLDPPSTPKAPSIPPPIMPPSPVQARLPRPPAATDQPAEPVGDDLNWMLDQLPDVGTPQTEAPAVAPTTSNVIPQAAAAAPELATDFSDVPEWLRTPSAEPDELTFASGVSAKPADQSDELDWLSNVDSASVMPPVSSTPAPVVAATNDQAGDRPLDLDLAYNSSDIDALLKLPASGVGPVSLAAPTTEIQPAAPSESTVEPAEEPVEAESPASNDSSSTSTSSVMDDFNLDEIFGPIDAAAEPVPPAETETPEPEPDHFTPNAPPAPLSERFKVTKLPADLPPSAPAIPIPSAVPPVPELTGQLLPNWLAEMQPTDEPVKLRIGDQEVRVKEQPISSLPDQVKQLRERARAFQTAESASPAATAGPLAGITGAIGTVPGLVTPRPAPVKTIVDDLYAQRVKTLQNILNVEEELLAKRTTAAETTTKDAALKARRATRAPRKFDRYLITLLLAAVIIAPFFTNVLNLFAPLTPASLSAAQQARFAAVTGTIDAIPAGQSVLVAFEYGPTAAAELDDMAQAILRDLIKHGVHPVIVSTNPAGALHAYSLVSKLGNTVADQALMNHPAALIAGQDYIVLRYLSGGAAAVHALADSLPASAAQPITTQANIQGKPAGLTADNASNLLTNPAFVLTETADDVRNWAEQYRLSSTASGPQPAPLKIVLLSAAGASAAASAYASSDNRIIGPLVGLRDSTIYHALRQPLSATDQRIRDQRWQSSGLAALLAAVIILVGAALNMIRTLATRRRNRA